MGRPELRRRRRRRIFAAAAVAALALWTAWGNLSVGVTRYALESDRLPAAFDGYRIVLVSDLHNAEFGEGNRRLIEQIEAERPDMIAITGDLIDARRTDVEMAGEFAQRLVEIAPCYCVTGNHEAYLGEAYPELERRLLDAGVAVLHDEALRLERGGECIQIVGLDDPIVIDEGEAARRLEESLGGVQLSGGYALLLSHRPEAFEVYVRRGIDLALCGHVHGGQFRLPLVGGVAAPSRRLFPEYDAGLYADGHTSMIVSRGLGNSTIPLRWNNRPELVRIELRCAT